MIELKTPRRDRAHARARAASSPRCCATLREQVRPGVTTAELDRVAEELTRKRGARAGVQGLRGRGPRRSRRRSASRSTTRSSTASRRRGACSTRATSSGSTSASSIDGYYGDAAVTVPVGTVTPEAQRLMDVTEAGARGRHRRSRGPGSRIGDVRRAIQDVRRGRGVLARPGVRRARHRPAAPRGPAGARTTGRRAGSPRSRADGPGQGRRLDGGDLGDSSPMVERRAVRAEVVQHPEATDGWTRRATASIGDAVLGALRARPYAVIKISGRQVRSSFTMILTRAITTDEGADA